MSGAAWLNSERGTGPYQSPEGGKVRLYPPKGGFGVRGGSPGLPAGHGDRPPWSAEVARAQDAVVLAPRHRAPGLNTEVGATMLVPDPGGRPGRAVAR